LASKVLSKSSGTSCTTPEEIVSLVIFFSIILIVFAEKWRKHPISHLLLIKRKFGNFFVLDFWQRGYGKSEKEKHIILLTYSTLELHY
jgi:hypothetical protein